MRWIFFAALLGITLLAAVLIADQLDLNKSVVFLNTANGKAIYAEHCAGCHGVNLEGQPYWRKRKSNGRLPAPPHDASGHTWHHSDKALFRTIKLGTEAIVGGDYKSDMPGFENVLSDPEIRAVINYIKSTWPKEIRRRQERISER